MVDARLVLIPVRKRRFKGAKMNLPDIEAVAAKVHEAWMNSKQARGVSSRTSEKGEELMVPYEQLSEEAKELDRAAVRAVYTAIRQLEES
jgi:TATA-binding protein-associated factor Taf7